MSNKYDIIFFNKSIIFGDNNRLYKLLFFTTFSILWGIYSASLGQPDSGDQLYYHYYSAQSFLSGTFLHSIAAGGLSGYNNPLIYFPFVFAVNNLSSSFILFLIGVWQSLNFILVFQIINTINSDMKYWRVAINIITVIYTFTTPIILMETGRTFADDWASVPFLLGIYLIVKNSKNIKIIAFATFLMGVSSGLKMTNVPLAAAFGIIFAAFSFKPRDVFIAGVSMLFGFFISTGWWFIYIYIHFGSPVFPYYNKIFRSPLYPPINFHDTRWRLNSLADLPKLPIQMARGTTSVVESTYRCSHWLVFWIVASMAFVVRVSKCISLRGLALSDRALLPFFCGTAFVVWAMTFHYVRYLMVADFVLPVALTILIIDLSGSGRATFVTLSILTALSGAVDHYLPSSWARVPSSGRWYHIPNLRIPANSSVILGNGIAFIEKALPPSTTMIGIGTNYFFAGLRSDGGTPKILNKINNALWKSPNKVYEISLLSLPETFNSKQVDQQFGFLYRPQACQIALTNLGKLSICHLSPEHKQAPPHRLWR